MVVLMNWRPTAVLRSLFSVIGFNCRWRPLHRRPHEGSSRPASFAGRDLWVRLTPRRGSRLAPLLNATEPRDPGRKKRGRDDPSGRTWLKSEELTADSR